jgi:putative tryptophan/tyrosine transport system substrate-binding protein
MRRRQFITLVIGSAAAWPFGARAQEATKVYRIGFVGAASAGSLPERPEAFRAGLRDLGYQQGRNIVIEYRWAEERYEHLPALFAELVRLNVDVIVTHGTAAALAAKQVTSTTPIVVAVIADPEASGVVASLARPGGNLTGLTYFTPELSAKRLELLKETMPGLTDVGVLINPDNPANAPIVSAVRRTAEPLKLKLHQFGARRADEIEAAFAEMAAKRIGALVVIDDAVLIANAKAVAQIALRQHLPSVGWVDYALAGACCLMGSTLPTCSDALRPLWTRF